MSRVSLFVVLLASGTAVADPAPAPTAKSPAAKSSAAPSAVTAPVIAPLLITDMPTLPVPSLRLEAVRIAGERADSDWRYPDPGMILGGNGNQWFLGYGHYRPRTARSAALHGGSMAATIAGQILMSADSPLAGVGALLTGATLDAAAADVDRDAESRRR